ncbi:MAG TPA: pyridoxamine 5'-phosphate oxidase family protein [Bacillota bacterium]|nr:pyridoxamine 5'-phosphate oxidase family protein [Bacillota bacterium]
MKIRRQDRLLDVESQYALLHEGKVGYLALVDEKQPYIVPLNYFLEENMIYFHCALEGRKLDIIARNPRFCFAVSEMDEVKTGPTACDFGTYYRSVLAYGHAHIIREEPTKTDILTKLTHKYCPPGMTFTPVTPERAAATLLVALEIEKLDGKSRQP